MHTLDTAVLSYLPTLVVDANIKHAQRLADRLSQEGFPADFAIDCAAAEAATRTRRYGSIVLVSTLDEHGTLDCVGSLRQRSPGTWIIVINDIAAPDAQQRVLRHGADALLNSPYSIEDLLARLLAFSIRSRPS